MRELVGARIVTPGDWTDLDLDPSTRHRSIGRAVQRAVARDPGLAGLTPRLIALLDDVTRRAQDAGGFFCSSMVLSSDDGPVVANVLMQLCFGETADGGPPTPECAGPMVADGGAPPPACAGPAAADGPPEAVCGELAAAVSCDPAWVDADVSVVSLPSIGQAVRTVVVAGGVCVQYLVPVPDSSEYVVLTFTSPSAPYAEAFVELFDSMAASFALDYENAAKPIG